MLAELTKLQKEFAIKYADSGDARASYKSTYQSYEHHKADQLAKDPRVVKFVEERRKAKAELAQLIDETIPTPKPAGKAFPKADYIEGVGW